MKRLKKIAVDKATEEYYIAYFGDYGKAWVGKIPRRVATALVRKLGQRVARAQIAPLGWAKTATGGITVEGVLRTYPTETKAAKTAEASNPAYYAFRADFDVRGRLTDLTHQAI